MTAATLKPLQPPPSLDATILELCRAEPGGRSIDPTDVATTFALRRGEERDAWRRHLADVRRAAVRLALDGRLTILRKGKPFDPSDFKGVYRLGLPSAD
jgi:hypothetical protein